MRSKGNNCQHGRWARCHKLAEWLEPRPQGCSSLTGQLSAGKAWITNVNGDYVPRSFDTDEAANAMLLDKMPEPELWLESSPGQPKVWGCTADLNLEYGAVFHSDRKAAVFQAALKQIEQEGEPS